MSQASAAVRPEPGAGANPVLAASSSLSDFLPSAGVLTLAERKLLVDQALVLLEQNYVHLPLKVAMHAVNPLQRLRVLRAQLQRQTDTTMAPEWRFHRELSRTFHSVRDLHTNYLLPAPFAGKVAFLPFQLELCHDADGTQHYLVTRLVTGFSGPGFDAGAEVKHWNGVPIAHAVALNGLQFAGSNPAASLARGLESLTLRPLIIQLPPDEEWVNVSYLGPDGAPHELRVSWQVTDNPPPMGDADAVSVASAAQGIDLEGDEKSRAKKMLFAPAVIDLEGGQTSVTLEQPAAAGGTDVPTTMPGVFRARTVQTAHGTIGHLRIFTFGVNDPVAFRDEFVRLAAALPRSGLVVDVRDNGGGHIYASEFTLQTLTPRRIVPEPVQFIGTPLNTLICRRHAENPTGQIDLGPWSESLEQSTETGSVFSAARPITPEDGANDVGQTYCGPAVLITDARCYSATDIFTAGWADHEIGPILGVDDNTGAGGANVWTHGLLAALMQLPTPDPDSPYQELPNGANMRVSIRRTLRVGALSGTPVEDLGVPPTHRHLMTRNDLLADNVDLLDRAAQLLADMPVRELGVSTSLDGGGVLTVQIEATGMDRADLAVDGRPRASVDLGATPETVTVPGVSAGQRLRVDGYASGQLVAARTVTT
ncbi:MAG: S41 family peptidase [Pseudonocardiaceae bacterium]